MQIKSPLPRHAIWYKVLKLLLKGSICPNVLAINIFFHNSTSRRYESFKNKCPICHTFFLLCIKHEIFKTLQIFSKSNYEWKNLYTPKTIEQIHPSNTITGSSFCIKCSNSIHWQRCCSKLPKFWFLSHGQQILNLLIIPNLYTLTNVIISRPVVIYELKLY